MLLSGQNTGSCSKITKPMPINTMPPASSALDLYFAPKRFPIHTPAAENNKNVVRPMTGTEGTSGTCRKANVTPTASASIEVRDGEREHDLRRERRI